MVVALALHVLGDAGLLEQIDGSKGPENTSVHGNAAFGGRGLLSDGDAAGRAW